MSDSTRSTDVQSAYDVINHAMYSPPNFEEQIIPQSLNRMFGTWIQGIYDNTVTPNSTLLWDILVFSNYIAMVMFIFLVMYVGWAAIMKTAADGEVFGKNWSPVWLPFRTGLAMALMFPLSIAAPDGSDSGIKVSTVQRFTIYLAFVGSKLGDMAANVIYDEVTRKPITTENYNPNQIYAIPNQIFKNLLCHEIKKEIDGDNKTNYWADDGIVRVRHNDLNSALTSIENSKNSFADFQNVPALFLYFGSRTGDCGAVNFPSRPRVSMASVDSSHTAGKQMGYAIRNYKSSIHKLVHEQLHTILSTTIRQMQPIAEEIAKHSIEDFKKAFETNNFEGVVQNYADRVNALSDDSSTFNTMTSQLIEGVKSYSNDDIENIMGEFKKTGWAGLGQLYFMIGSISEIKPSVTNSYFSQSYVVNNRPNNRSKEEDSGWFSFLGWGKSNTDAKFDSNFNLKYDLFPDLLKNNKLGSADSIISCNSSSGLCEINPDSISKSSQEKMKKHFILNLMIDGTSEDETIYADIFPIASLQSMGSNILLVSQGLYLSGNIIKAYTTGTKVAASTAPSWAMLGTKSWVTLVEAIASPILMVLLITTPIIIGIGFFLAYILPMMPTMIWIMMVVSYLVMVIESVAASPLAVVQLATPEGEGISGTRMERAMSILAALLLTPTLNVIGFIASITMLFVAFPIYNSMFFTAWSFVSSQDYTLNFLVSFVAAISLYTGGLFILIRFCYLIMPNLKQHILEWFSSGPSRAFGENEGAQRMEAATDKFESKAISGAGRRNNANQDKDITDTTDNTKPTR